MAIFRKIHVTFWSDSFISELKDREKLFYIYILTNERTTQCGVYEITKKQISFDLGYSIDTVSALIKQFQKIGKIKYNDTTCELAVKNWKKYNYNPSPKVKVLTDKEFHNVKDKSLIEYLNSSDTVSIHNNQEEEEPEGEKELKKVPVLFKDSLIFDRVEFKKAMPEDWNKERLLYYYEAAIAWSGEGKKKIDWVAAIKTWARKDEKEGKLKFTNNNYVPLQGTLE